MATTKWTGNASNVGHQMTLTVAGAWTATETVTLTLNSAKLVMTVTANMTSGEVAAALSAMINGDAITGLAETRSSVGISHVQWFGVTATVVSSVVTLVHSIDGFPYTVSAADTGVGSVTAAVSVQGTGRNWISNADNWDNGVPASADTVIVDGDETSVPMLYDLGAFSGDTWAAAIFRRAPEVGLSNESFSYETDLIERLTVGITSLDIRESIGSTMRLNTGTVATTLYANGANTVDWVGVHSSNALIANGNTTLNIAVGIGESASLATVLVNGSTLVIGDLCTIATSITGLANASITVNDSIVPLVSATNSRLIINGRNAVTTATLYEATGVFNTTGTITTINNGVRSNVNLANDGRLKNVTTLNMSKNSTLLKSSQVTIGTIAYATDVTTISTN